MVVAQAGQHDPSVYVENASLGDFRPLFREHFQYICATLKRLGVRESDIEDVVQDVFVVVHRKLDTYDATRPVQLWLFGICLRTASSYRRQAHLRRHVPEETQRELAHSDPLPDDLLAIEQNRQLVFAALDALDLHRRAVFVMHDLDEFSAPQIAEALSIPVNTVYSRLRLAREEFKKAVHRIRANRGSR